MPKPRSTSVVLFALPLLALGLSGIAHAQPAPAEPAQHQPVQQTEVQTSGAGTNTTTVTRDGRRVEQITLEDGGSRVDELREGGETRHITVQPKNGSPAYDVRPPSSGAGDRSHDGGSGSSGPRSWKLIQF